MNFINRILPALCLIGIVSGMSTQIYAQVTVKSLGLNVGYYSPEMDYWNDIALPTWDEQFKGSISGNFIIEVLLADPVSARLDVGYYKEELSQSGIPHGTDTRTDDISIQMIPATFSMIGRIHPVSTEPLEFFGGAGLGVNLITMKYTRTMTVGGTDDDLSGRNYLVYFITGLDYPVMANFGLGLEFRYVWGTYKQLLGTEGLSAKVSVNGPQGFLSLKYLF